MNYAHIRPHSHNKIHSLVSYDVCHKVNINVVDPVFKNVAELCWSGRFSDPMQVIRNPHQTYFLGSVINHLEK